MANAQFQLVIKNTDPVPGMPGAAWATSSPFNASSIDSSGNVAFRAGLLNNASLGITSSNNSTLWYGAPGLTGANMYARTGFQAPGLAAGVNVTSFQGSNVGISGNGVLYLGGGTTAPNGYIATGTSLSLTHVARNGDVLPGIATAISGNPASNTGYTNVNSSGPTVVFTTAGTSNGMWVGNGGNLQLTMQTGASFGGLPATTVANTNGFMINGTGSLYNGIQLTNSVSAGITTNNNSVLATLPFRGSTYTVIAQESGTAPACGGATYARVFFDAGLGFEASPFATGNGNYNNLGHSIFSCGLEGTGVTTANNAAVFYNDGTTSNLLHRKGDSTTAVPGATLAISTSTALSVRVNNSDSAVYTTSLTTGVGGVTSTTAAVLLQTTQGSATDTLIARQGSTVPAIPGALWGTFSNVLQNNAGQIVFSSTMLDDPSDSVTAVTTANDLALFVWDPTIGYLLLGREGDNLSSVGINMTLTGSWISEFTNANAEGGANALSDNGWLTLRVSGTALAGFSDNQAIVRLQVVPEPTSAGLLCAAGLTVLRRRRVAK